MTGLAGFAAAAPQTASIKIEVADGRCIAPVILNGQLAPMVIDTGAERSLITRAAAVRLGLAFDRWVDTTLRDAGGRLETHPNADVAVATLGGLPLYQRPATHALSLSVAATDLGIADGLLGADVLRNFTLALDVHNASLTLSAAGDAPKQGGISLRPLWPDFLLAPLTLDGCDLAALVDTGATSSVINARGLYRLGLTPERLGRDEIVSLTGVNGRLPVHLHRFANLSIGPLNITSPKILAARVPEAGFDMILGMDFLGLRSLRLSYSRLILKFDGA